MIRIVIVEDELPIQTGLRNLIGHLSDEYKIVGVASTVHDGMILIKQTQPDLAFCDIKLGKNNSLDMIEALNDSGVVCKYVILSGYSEFSFAQRAIKLGVIDYMVKPASSKQISHLLKTFTEQTKKAEPNKSSVMEAAPYSQVVAFAIDRIQTSYASVITLSGIAEEAGITPQYLSALFAKEAGVSFVTYLRNIRINKSKQLLKDSNKKINDIAFEVGYDDPQYFCRVFKLSTGVSPKSYRLQKAAFDQET